MVIGILHEGKFDDRPIEEIIIRLLLEKSPDLARDEIKFRKVSAGGEILSKMHIAATIFFESEPIVDFAVYLSDLDKFHNRKKEIDQWIEIYQRTNSSAIIVTGTADPVFENWFLIEENAIKNHLNLPSSRAIPFNDLKPKPRVEKLIEEFSGNDPVISRIERYTEITKNLNLDLLAKKDPKNFGFFRQRFFDALNSLTKN